MKNYIKKNLEPILMGIILGMLLIIIINAISDTILKINLIK